MRRGLAIGLALAGATVAAGAYALGPGAPVLVEALADGRTVWRLGTLDVTGVRGAWIGDLTVSELRLSDETGVWLEGRNARVRWSPLRLLTGRVRLQDATIEEVVVARRPVLGAPPRSRGLDFIVSAPSLHVRALRLAEPVAGVEAQLVLTGAVQTADGSLRTLKVEAVRADAATDRVLVDFAAGADRPWTVSADGAPGGVLAGLVGAEQAVFIAGGAISGNGVGQGELTFAVGDAIVVQASGDWDTGGWRAQGEIDPSAARGLSFLARLGGAATVQAQGGDEGRFSGAIVAPALNATIEGAWDGDMAVLAETRRADVLFALEETPAQELRAEGVLRRDEAGGQFDGTLSAEGLSVAGLRGVAEGPVAASWTRQRIRVSAEAAVRGAFDRFEVSSAEGEIAYDRQAERLAIERFAIEGPQFTATADGDTDEVRGRLFVRDLTAVFPLIDGQASATFVALRAGEAWRIDAEGTGERVSADDPIGPLIGPRPRISFSGIAHEGLLVVERATISGPQLRLGARGRVSASALDLTWEGSGRGPITLAGVGVDGTADASGRVIGSPRAPRITGSAQLARLDLGGAALEPAQVRFAYADGAGTVDLTGQYGTHMFSARGDVVVRDESVAIEGLTADLGGLTAVGEVGVTAGALSGDLSLRGPVAALTGQAGAVEARLSLAGTGDEPEVDAQGSLSGVTFGAARIEAADFSVSGPLATLRYNAAGEGTIGEGAFAISAFGGASFHEGDLDASASVEGTVAGHPVVSVAPLRMRRRGNALDAQGALVIGGGQFDFDWRAASGSGFTVTAALQNVPASAFAALAGERAEGLLSGRATLASDGRRLSGEAQLAAEGFRIRGRMDAPVNARLSGRLANEAVTADVVATSEDGLSASAELSAAVRTQAQPLRIALDESQGGRAQWRVEGPADAVWALAGTPDQSISGRLAGAGEARFGPGRLTGSGQLSLADGVFEDRLSGVRLQNVALDVRFSDETVTIEALSATDGDGGRLSGSGALSAAREGSLTLALSNLRFIDREDVTARANGDLDFRWDQDGGTLSGALNLTEATIRGAPVGEISVPDLEVIEINRPAVIAGSRSSSRRGPVTRLSLTVQAPQRVFTRYRGMDAEWSLDLSVTGTTGAPELFGEARLLRGEGQLAGRPLEFTRGRIRFQGAPEEAELDVAAVHESPDLTARLVLAGTVGRPEVRIENDRGLPDDEVLPLLLFGASQEELSPLQAAQLAASLSALTGGSAFDLADLTRRIVGLDRLDVRQEADGILVAGGRYLTRRVYVELARTGLGEAQTRVEWQLTRNLTLITSFAEDGEQRASLRWREEEEAR